MAKRKKVSKKVVKNPKVGQFVFDKHYKKKRKVMAVPMHGNNLYFIGEDHEPVSRSEFIFPLPKKKTK